MRARVEGWKSVFECLWVQVHHGWGVKKFPCMVSFICGWDTLGKNGHEWRRNFMGIRKPRNCVAKPFWKVEYICFSYSSLLIQYSHCYNTFHSNNSPKLSVLLLLITSLLPNSLSMWVCTKPLESCPTLWPWTVTCQAPLSMGFSRQEYWSGLPFPSPGDLPNSGIKLMSLMSPT